MFENNNRRGRQSIDSARQLGLDALLFLAQDETRIATFLQASGIDAGNLRAKAREDSTLAAVLEYLLANESLMLVFCAHGNQRPEDVFPALEKLQAEGKIL